MALFAAAAFVGGCPSGDPEDSGGGSGDESGGPPDGPGLKIECCYQLSNITPGTPPVTDVQCTNGWNWSPCIDPTAEDVDTNQDGMLSAQNAWPCAR